VESYWNRRLRGLWDRIRQLVERRFGRHEQLSVAVGGMYPDPDHIARYGPEHYQDTPHVLRLFHQHLDRADRRLEPLITQSTGPVGPSVTRTLQGQGEPSFTVTFDSAARYSDCE
jgi:hypothetical protein